jgi:hypothetical protein
MRSAVSRSQNIPFVRLLLAPSLGVQTMQFAASWDENHIL